MQWVDEAKRLFNVAKPKHFTDYNHCEECAEHDETLRNSCVDSISMKELGNPAWDPICFCNIEGKHYYMPAFIRLTLETIDSDDITTCYDCYLEQILFHLEYDGKKNDLFLSCNVEQRQFIVKFLEYILEVFVEKLEYIICTDDIVKVHEIWSDEKTDKKL